MRGKSRRQGVCCSFWANTILHVFRIRVLFANECSSTLLGTHLFDLEKTQSARGTWSRPGWRKSKRKPAKRQTNLHPSVIIIRDQIECERSNRCTRFQHVKYSTCNQRPHVGKHCILQSCCPVAAGHVQRWQLARTLFVGRLSPLERVWRETQTAKRSFKPRSLDPFV